MPRRRRSGAGRFDGSSGGALARSAWQASEQSRALRGLSRGGGRGGSRDRSIHSRRQLMGRQRVGDYRWWARGRSGALVAFALLASACGYNTIQTKDEAVNAAASQIKTQLQRRADLIPNLVETVKGFAKQETTIFIRVAEA